MQIRSRQAADRPAVRAFLAQRGHARAARLGEVVDPLDYPALISEAEDGPLLGVLTYVVDRDQCEILTLHTAEQWQGVGTALVEAVERLATRQGCRRLWLITTNDNLDALRFYQRRGFRLAALHRGAVDDSRARLKPEIPTVGDYGIPLRDEVELDKAAVNPATWRGLAGGGHGRPSWPLSQGSSANSPPPSRQRTFSNPELAGFAK